MNIKFVTCCFRLSHDPPPHSHGSRTRLPASVAQFCYLLLTVFPFKALCMQPLLITIGFMNVRLQFKFKTDGTELPATDANNHSVCRTNNVRLQVEDYIILMLE